MGKKDGYTGESPKDRSTNIIDKFITRNANKVKHLPVLPGRRKDINIPIHMWPLKDQLDYWENMTASQLFDRTYKTYAVWYEELNEISGVYHQTFIDFTTKLKDDMHLMFANKMLPKAAMYELRKKGVY
jgi:hypothetical protein